jgi:uncharacterized protein
VVLNSPKLAFLKEVMPGQPSFRYFSPWLLLLSFVWLVFYCGYFNDPLILAQKKWPLVLVGVAGALIGNITAIGGGIVFIPVMVFVYHLDPVQALKLAFVTQAVGMSSGATGWLRRGEVPLSLLKWTVPSLIMGSLIASFLFHPQPMLVKGLFGPVAFLTGLLTLITLNRTGQLFDLPANANWPVCLIALLGGMITGWVAIGEGEIIAAFCMLMYGLNPNRAIGLGVVLLAINSLLLALLHAFYFGGVPWDLAAFTMLGVLWGGRLGPFLGQRIHLKTIKKTFAYIALLDGLIVTMQAYHVLIF